MVGHVVRTYIFMKKTLVQMAKANGVRWYEHVVEKG